ncbi:MAG: hypothetical protein CM1200mP30_01320 [Pseudomonadota bacterium]|nr:MAG: hypothetical protein CM1200mP30_01320 [Pseudomonadota bacterium]
MSEKELANVYTVKDLMVNTEMLIQKNSHLVSLYTPGLQWLRCCSGNGLGLVQVFEGLQLKTVKREKP